LSTIIDYDCLSVCVCLSVTPLQIASSFLFLDGIETFFGRQFSCRWHSTKLVSSIFDLGPLTPKIYPPNFLRRVCDGSWGSVCHNATLPRCHRCGHALGTAALPIGKVGNPLNFGVDPCCYGNEIWSRRGDLDAYRLVTLLIVLS